MEDFILIKKLPLSRFYKHITCHKELGCEEHLGYVFVAKYN